MLSKSCLRLFEALFVLLLIPACLCRSPVTYYDQINDARDSFMLPEFAGDAVQVNELTERDLKETWSQDTGSSLKDRLQLLQEFEAVTAIDVLLVGFDGEGAGKIKLEEKDFARYFDAILDDHKVHIISTERHQSHDLPVRNKYVYRVKKAKASLHNELQKALTDHLTNAQVRAVPYSVVDSIISSHFEDQSLSYTVYLLNIALPGVAKLDQFPYGYILADPSSTSTHDPNKQSTDCGSTVYASQDRYVWVDLTAGPVTYGPQTSGDGIVTELTIPQVKRFIPEQAQSSPNKDYNLNKQEFIAELANLVFSAIQHLITPPLWRFPVPYVSQITVQIITIHDKGPHADDSHGKQGSHSDRGHLDIEAIKEQLGSVLLSGQTLNVKQMSLSFTECELCVSAYTHAVKSHTSNVLTDALRTQVHSYLDSHEMHDWLEHFDDAFWGIRQPPNRQERVIPVFLFDLSFNHILLFERFYQAVSFPDMVLAVQTRTPAALVDFGCNNGQMAFSPQSATRPVLAALLQTGWGVAPTHLTWSEFHGNALENHLWAVAHTPFGYFSHSTRFSFAQRDCAARSVIYSELNRTLSDMKSVMNQFMRYNRELDEVLTLEEQLIFIRRWNLFKYKLDKASSALSLQGFNSTLIYIRSMRPDLRAIRTLVSSVIHKIRTSFICLSDVPTVSIINIAVVVSTVAVCAAMFLLWYREKQPTVTKRTFGYGKFN